MKPCRGWSEITYERLSWYIESRTFHSVGEHGIRGKPSSGIYAASFSCGIAIDKRGKDAARDAFVRFVRPQPVKIAVSVVSKGERVRSRYKFEDYGNSAIRAATRVTSFPWDYLADGEGGGLCWQRILLCRGARRGKYRSSTPVRAAFSPRAAFNKRITLAPFKRSHFWLQWAV